MDAKPQKPKRSLFDRAINAFAVLILIFAAINEFSHLYRVPESISAAPQLYERHVSWSGTFPFVGSYFLMTPEGYDPRQSYPLVVALHGVSSRIYAAEALASASFRKNFPAFVMVPIAPARAFWATPENPAYRMKRNIPYPDHLAQVMAGIDAITASYSIDRSRVYIVGHSTGAAGVMGALERYPDRFAAGIASAGLWDGAQTRHVNDPLWILHGTADPAMPFAHSRTLAAELKARGVAARFNSLSGRGHDIGPTVYAKPELWTWLLNQRSNAKK
ncbi:prolyl oligopeptidase family serine peptidase [Gloeobacter morelensis]|uniref:Prolyl oligopeptidase family serine peptidase n=1 Tax=Gloeobacter morelensis MG652769 TaxID=2781736 RepID=A0ABY3PLQ9_9CYAN|nr:prolyl oligopeptidase family serine peptidase [Gloeobacter morelensis]UFP94616.1 prolyl oligopeptidase family serine peptidase [Gloeobacter morelensis MG652769]